MMSQSNSNSNSKTNSGSCGSGSDSLEATAKKGDGSRTLPDFHSADLGTSASALSPSDTKSMRHKPMNWEEEIASLKETIKSQKVDLGSLSK